MTTGLRPRTQPDWMRWVEGRLRRLSSQVSAATVVPIGGAVVWTGTGTPPAGWMTANGATFDSTDYPDLAARLGSTTLPTLTAVSGKSWIVRAE